MALQMLLRCGVEALSPRLHSVLPQSEKWLVGQASTVVILVAMEENLMTSLPVTENIRLGVLEDVVLYMERESNLENKRVLLQCFGKVLTGLMLTRRDVTSDGFFHIKEYFKIPLASLTEVLRAVDISTVRQILQYFNRNKDALKLSEAYVSTMVSVLFQTQLSKDPSLFPELAPLLGLASPTDIQAFPRLQDNLNVKTTINDNLVHLSLEKRWAFGRWYRQAFGPGNITAGGLMVVRDTGNLITCLPFVLFQLLSPAQILDGLDVLLRNPLTLLQQQFVAQSVFGTFRNLTAMQFHRLGNLSCLAEPQNLLLYKDSEAFSGIQDKIRSCAIHGVSLPSNMISSLFLNTSDLKSPGSLSSARLSQLADFLPWLGIDFLQKLNQSQLNLSLPALSAVTFSSAEAAVIVDKLSSNTLFAQGGLQQLGSLVKGVKVETLWSLSSKTLLSSLPAMALPNLTLSPSQANAVASKLWGSVNVTAWLDQVEPLLSSTPLLSLLSWARPLMTNTSSTNTRPWNTQQAQALFQEVMNIKSNLSPQAFLALGTIGPGASCKVLKKLFFSQPSSSSLRSLLVFLREQPVPLHTSLTKCVIEELYKLDLFSNLLGELGAQLALAMTVSTIKKFPSDMMNSLRKMIVQEPRHFLLLPRTKQELLVDKMVQTLEMYTGQYTQEEFQSLGVMATSVVDEMFVQLDRKFLMDSVELLRTLCYSSSKRDLMALILQEPDIFGPVQNWTTAVLNQVDRFIFFLPPDKLKLLPPALLTQGRIERLFQNQRRWEGEEMGALCMAGRDQEEKVALFGREQFLLQYFLGFLTMGRLTAPTLVPSCENLKSTAPSAWSIGSLTGMSNDAFTSCLELIGQDPFLTPYELTVLLKKTNQVYGAVASFPPSVVSRLGRLALQLTVEELGTLRLSELSSVAALGAISTWSTRQLPALFSALLNSTKLSPSQLDSSTLVAIGHIICGISSVEIRTLNAVQFSKAVMWLGHLRLACSEEQLASLVGLLSHDQAFGLISSWGPQVFIEIGVLAAGIPDMSMSALVKEQIEGFSPLAVSLIPPQKFTVVFNQAQINMFSYEQAMAVTPEQRALLSDVQQTALSMVLTPWENRPLDFRGLQG
ncbi:stereocilin isoform X2 [Osmerus eperlanus]|uniref:stereocilin isoform X2 n=1 Tax=Osmerus eperlanus TaxID=29151 RepID=UPI002E11412D